MEGKGQELTSPVLTVGNHRHLVPPTGQEVGEADLDVLARGLDEGDVLAVDDPGRGSAVPAALLSVLVLLTIGLRRLARGRKYEGAETQRGPTCRGGAGY